MDPHSSRLRQSIVRILRLGATGDGVNEGAGTGFCLAAGDAQGLVPIATASHVVKARHIQAMTDDPDASRVEAADGSSDVVRAPWIYDDGTDHCAFHTRLALPPLRIATALPKVGERVFAAGFRSGVEYQVSEGALEAYTLEGKPYLVFTGDIAPGFSGGPLLNARGEVVGLTVVRRSTGNNGALPTFEVTNLRQRILFLQQVRDSAAETAGPQQS